MAFLKESLIFPACCFPTKLNACPDEVNRDLLRDLMYVLRNLMDYLYKEFDAFPKEINAFPTGMHYLSDLMDFLRVQWTS